MNRNIIIDILKKEKPDIIHTNNIYEITPIIWKTAKENGIHTVHTIRDYYLMCYKTNLLKRIMKFVTHLILGVDYINI